VILRASSHTPLFFVKETKKLRGSLVRKPTIPTERPPLVDEI
jgi:hypothetical protein